MKNTSITTESMLSDISSGRVLTNNRQLLLILKLSIPTIFSQIAYIMMEYIDASMVGRLGADSSAAIGLVSSSTWMFGGLCSAAATGFSVQVAQFIGARKKQEAREVLDHAILSIIFLGLFLAFIGISISGHVPIWLGGSSAIYERSRNYFLVYVCALPVMGLNTVATNTLQSSGNMKIPSILNILMCFMDVFFNAFFIFPQRHMQIGSLSIIIPGANLGVIGAALGTVLAEAITAGILLYFLIARTPVFKKDKSVRFHLKPFYIKRAFHIAYPIAFENLVVTGAMVATTRIVSPFGNIALSAHSFAITAESLCYMPGYGIANAATTLVGQSIGAGRKQLAKQLASKTTQVGMLVMTATGIIMFLAAHIMISILSPDPQVQALGTLILRIEAFAEPMYAASIVISGALQGAGDTFIPSLMNFFSMWAIRIPLSIVLAIHFGLVGVWIAMCVELCFRGTIFLVRLIRGKWLKKVIVQHT